MDLFSLRKLQPLTFDGSLRCGQHAYRGDVGRMGEDAQPTKLDKYHERLARLERKVVQEDIMELSQNEYLAHIDFLRQEIRAAWGRDERVNTLKLVVQCAKLLADNNVPQFYPSMFVRITEVLDMFSNMVYNRLKMKAEDALTGTSHRRVKLKGMACYLKVVGAQLTMLTVFFRKQRNLLLLTSRARRRRRAGIGFTRRRASPSWCRASTSRWHCCPATGS